MALVVAVVAFFGAAVVLAAFAFGEVDIALVVVWVTGFVVLTPLVALGAGAPKAKETAAKAPSTDNAMNFFICFTSLKQKLTPSRQVPFSKSSRERKIQRFSRRP